MSSRASTACFNFALAIAIGAFGAHSLKGKIPEANLTIFHTGHDYHMWMAVALLALAWNKAITAWFYVCGYLGTLLFSGSLYALAVTDMRILGAITPLGGVVWIGSLVGLGIFLGLSGPKASNMEQQGEKGDSVD